MKEAVQNGAGYAFAQRFVRRLCTDGVIAHDHPDSGKDKYCIACDIRGKLANEFTKEKQ